MKFRVFRKKEQVLMPILRLYVSKREHFEKNHTKIIKREHLKKSILKLNYMIFYKKKTSIGCLFELKIGY